MNNQNHINQALDLFKKGFSTSAVIRRIIKEGMSENEAEILVVQVESDFRKSNNKKSKIIWVTITLLILIINQFFVPVTSSFSHPILIVIIFGVITGLTAMQIAFSYRNIDEFFAIFAQKTSEKDDKKQLLLMIVFIAFSISFNYVINNLKVETEFKKHGETVKGIVFNGQEETSKSRKSTTTAYTLNYSFTTKSKKDLISKYNVTREEYSRSYKDVTVDVLYSKRFPEINKISAIHSIYDLFKKE